MRYSQFFTNCILVFVFIIYSNSDALGQDKELVDNYDGTVSDFNQGVMWQKEDDGAKRTWKEATEFCASLDLAGYTDWRTPMKDELSALISIKKRPPMIDDVFICRKGTYWTGSVSNIVSAAWNVDFMFGRLQVYHIDVRNKYFVRCIRDNTLKK